MTAIVSVDTYRADERVPYGGGTVATYDQTAIMLRRDETRVVLYHDRTMSLVVDGNAIYLNEDDTRELLVQMMGAWT